MGDPWLELGLFASTFAVLVVIVDACVKPRGRGGFLPRDPLGMLVLLLVSAVVFGLLLVVTGAPLVSGIAVVGLAFVLALVSNIKRDVLGEPLVFSDFALIVAVFRHPQFYISALRPWQLVLLGGAMIGLVATLALLTRAGLALRLAGAMIAAAAWLGSAYVLPVARRATIGPLPDPDADVQRLGLVASLLTHWHDWRRSVDPAPCEAEGISGRTGQLVVIVQCESFTDPADLLGDASLVAPGLDLARKLAWRQGRLMVSGFGAYTMRTEYGVLFGRDEAMLGTRRFDPFLTAEGEASWALPNRLARGEWTSWFLHPHDMRFYGRDRLLPKCGFDRLVGEESFVPPETGEGRYVTDAAVADRILQLARERSGADLVYTVTIENHGPWPPAESDGTSVATPYLRLFANSDAMLTRLVEELPRLGRPTILCFFGDHRPSIPGASEPGAERHTPFVLLRFGVDGAPVLGSGEGEALPPAELHHAILAAIELGETER